MNKIKTVVLTLVGLALTLTVVHHILFKNDPRAASVKITNRAGNSGGTGIILSSSKAESNILTNDHVCKLLKQNGGLVITKTQSFQVTSIVESEVSDLCLVQVSDDLGVQTSITNSPPETYDIATVSGHPALLPNVVTTGHYSGRSIIQVMTGMKKCEEADMEDPNKLILCAFFGGLPVIKSYESVLVTATIMPGSSGSGVYNSSNELAGVVFAGSGELGYAWTVPYQQLLNFVNRERLDLKKQYLSQEINIFEQKGEFKHIKELLQKCNTAKKEVIINFCNIISRDMTWRN
jgi:S1-C subfamily serine protease